MPMSPTGYWILVCNPRKWAFDKFVINQLPKKNVDSWGVRPSDAPGFAPGQLALIRVGVDKRNKSQLEGRPRLEAGIYALCEISSKPYMARGAGDKYWSKGSGRKVDWPTVQLRYLKTFLDDPLTIAELRRKKKNFNRHVLSGLQTSSFPIPEADFEYIVENLSGAKDRLKSAYSSGDMTWAKLAEIERRLLSAAPAVKTVVSKRFERGPIGDEVKRANGYKCQICEQLGLPPLGFKKIDGKHYVEAHHVVPISTKALGSAAHGNVISVCPNHHRQLHFGGVRVDFAKSAFLFYLPEKAVRIKKFRVDKN
ncbi:MAG: EVE domain-containing protein [Afipia sp.]|nr:EVE domain-containing protein [Afipia sp.]